jgi:hypothetical protein
MPNFKVAPRVKQTSTSSGTGTLNLDGAAAASYENFSDQFSTGDLVGYAIAHSSADEWEEGIGTVTTGSPWTLARTTVLKSSNANAAVNFSSGGLDVFCNVPTGFALGPVSLPVARQNVTSTSETDTSLLTVPANTWGDGEVLEIIEAYDSLNNSGASITWTRKIYAGATSATLLSAGTVTASATRRSHETSIRLIRSAGNIYYYGGRAPWGSTISGSIGFLGMSAVPALLDNKTLLVSGADFAAAITIKISMQLSAYNASTAFYNADGGKATLG